MNGSEMRSWTRFSITSQEHDIRLRDGMEATLTALQEYRIPLVRTFYTGLSPNFLGAILHFTLPWDCADTMRTCRASTRCAAVTMI